MSGGWGRNIAGTAVAFGGTAVDDRTGGGDYDDDGLAARERHSWNVDGNAAAPLTRGRYAPRARCTTRVRENTSSE